MAGVQFLTSSGLDNPGKPFVGHGKTFNELHTPGRRSDCSLLTQCEMTVYGVTKMIPYRNAATRPVEHYRNITMHHHNQNCVLIGPRVCLRPTF